MDLRPGRHRQRGPECEMGGGSPSGKPMTGGGSTLNPGAQKTQSAVEPASCRKRESEAQIGASRICNEKPRINGEKDEKSGSS